MTAKGDKSRDRLLVYLVNYFKQSGRIPTYKQMSKDLGREQSHIFGMMKALEDNGLIARDPRSARGITILKAGFERARKLMPRMSSYVDREFVDVAFIQFRGYIAGGRPINILPVEDVDDSIRVLRSQLPAKIKIEDCFALRVKGNSMIQDGIADGDLVILKNVSTANNGDIVAVWLDDYERITLKIFSVRDGQVQLYPRNRELKPILVKHPERMHIQGKFVCLISAPGN